MGRMNLLSILIGLFMLPAAAIAFIPFLGWMYWFILPVAVIGAGIGALSRSSTGRNLNLLVLLVGIVRLMLGGGFV